MVVIVLFSFVKTIFPLKKSQIFLGISGRIRHFKTSPPRQSRSNQTPSRGGKQVVGKIELLKINILSISTLIDLAVQ